MQKAIFPALIVAGVLFTAYKVTETEAPDEETAVKLAVNGREAEAVTPYLQAAARQMGHSRVRAYDEGVFIDSDNASIYFTEAKDGMEMHVAFESKYRIPARAREAALKDLKAHGEQIFAKAQELKSLDAMGGAMARADVPKRTGG
jgi:hypothetical protein